MYQNYSINGHPDLKLWKWLNYLKKDYIKEICYNNNYAIILFSICLRLCHHYGLLFWWWYWWGYVWGWARIQARETGQIWVISKHIEIGCQSLSTDLSPNGIPNIHNSPGGELTTLPLLHIYPIYWVLYIIKYNHRPWCYSKATKHHHLLHIWDLL